VQIDPRISMLIMLVVAVLGAVASASAQLTDLFGAGDAKLIVSGAGFALTVLSPIAAILHGLSSPAPGPLISQAPQNPGPSLKIMLVILAAGVLLLAGPALAQTRKPLTGDPTKDIPNIFNQGQPQKPSQNPLDELAAKIAKLSLADFQYAAALAHATNNTVTASCWDEWVKLVTAQQSPLKDAQGNVLEEPPVHLATDIERLSEMIRQMQPNSELSVACAPMAQAAQKDVGVLIGAVLSGGAMGLFKLPFAIP